MIRTAKHMQFMNTQKSLITLFLLCAVTARVCCQTPSQRQDASAYGAHEAYVTAINSNDLGQLLAVLTEDVVFLAPNERPIVGKAAVRPWLEGYLKALKTHWDKPVQEFVVNGDWAFERYSYMSADTPLADGEVVKDSGWGLLIYHRDSDGKWRVARDAWGSDRPLAPK